MLWDLAEGKRLYNLDAGEIIYALCFSPNRYWLCAATTNVIKVSLVTPHHQATCPELHAVSLTGCIGFLLCNGADAAWSGRFRSQGSPEVVSQCMTCVITHVGWAKGSPSCRVPHASKNSVPQQA